MRLTIWGINYAPEPIGIAPFNTDLAEYLAEQGHEVTVVTSFPYYPNWSRRAEDRGQLFRSERAARVSLKRCWCYVPRRVTSLKRMAHELSFVWCSLLRVLLLPRPDLMIVISPPLGLGVAAWIASRLRRTQYIFHVQDLQPDAAVSLGMVKKGAGVRFLYGLERFAYAKAAVVSGISRGMMTAFWSKGLAHAKTALVPNWLRSKAEPTGAESASAEAAKARFGIAPDDLLCVYAGNLGRKQNLGVLLDAARAIATAAVTPGVRRVRFLVAGDGAGREALEVSLRENPTDNLTLLPLLDEPDYRQLLAAADVALITQAAG
ncbi:MAG TPA: glycosyltransferase, partial [Candidatus Synoicihabitans sp.]|nr:glycosyltransferase [Candidatus Synoicihabitans sp.]